MFEMRADATGWAGGRVGGVRNRCSAPHNPMMAQRGAEQREGGRWETAPGRSLRNRGKAWYDEEADARTGA